jgi:hypothetical protein
MRIVDDIGTVIGLGSTEGREEGDEDGSLMGLAALVNVVESDSEVDVIGLGSTEGREEGNEDGSLKVLAALVNVVEAKSELEVIEDEGSGVVGRLGGPSLVCCEPEFGLVPDPVPALFPTGNQPP